MTPQNTTDKVITKLIGKRIMFFRKEQKMGRELLASKTGICKEQLCNYERGKRRITADCLFEIARVLNIKVINFFPVFALGDNIENILPCIPAQEAEILSEFAKAQNISVEELVLKFIDMLLK